MPVRGVYYCSVEPTVQVHTLYRNVEVNTALLLGEGGGCAWARKYEYIGPSSRLLRQGTGIGTSELQHCYPSGKII
jgi:hypothetical protein